MFDLKIASQTMQVNHRLDRPLYNPCSESYRACSPTGNKYFFAIQLPQSFPPKQPCLKYQLTKLLLSASLGTNKLNRGCLLTSRRTKNSQNR